MAIPKYHRIQLTLYTHQYHLTMSLTSHGVYIVVLILRNTLETISLDAKRLIAEQQDTWVIRNLCSWAFAYSRRETVEARKLDKGPVQDNKPEAKNSCHCSRSPQSQVLVLCFNFYGFQSSAHPRTLLTPVLEALLEGMTKVTLRVLFHYTPAATNSVSV